MASLRELKQNKVYIDLAYLADFVETRGVSTTIPLTDDGEVSLSFALASLCGYKGYPQIDDFFYFVDAVPALYRPQFIRCWEAIELEVEQDIVSWSEKVGTTETVRRLRSLSKEIELS